MHCLRLLALSCFLAVAPSWATVILQLTTSTQDAGPGQTIVFGGLITNNYAEIVDLNGLSINLAGPFTFDISPFFAITAPFFVDPNSSTIVYDWFTVTVADPYTDSPGIVNGTITLLGGLEGPNGYDPSTQDVLATVSFSVNVVSGSSGASDVPEPATAPLLLSLLIPLLWRAHSARRTGTPADTSSK